MYRLGLAIAALILLAACGGVAGGINAGTGGSSGGLGSAPGQFAPVAVVAGATTTGVDITVPAPAGTALNAENIGASGGGSFAFSTGTQIRAGETATVFLFGTGLSGNMQVKISGPSDIAISNIAAANSQSGTAGIQFTAAVAANAALGARTVFLIDTLNNMTALSGGLEVVSVCSAASGC